jgi:hypothetical protein
VGSIGELLAAVGAANSSPGEDVIQLDAPADAVWTTTGAIAVDDALRLERAPGSGTVTIESSDDSAFVLADGVTFIGSGFGATGTAGYGIDARLGADVVLTDVVLAGSGGSGLEQSGGTLRATRVSVHGNGVAGISALNMDDVVLDAVTATVNPVGIHVGSSGGTVTVSDSTISDNGAPGPSTRGGLIVSATDGAQVTVESTTISDNQALRSAGLQIDTLRDGSRLIVRNSRITGNTAGAGAGWAPSIRHPGSPSTATRPSRSTPRSSTATVRSTPAAASRSRPWPGSRPCRSPGARSAATGPSSAAARSSASSTTAPTRPS